MFPSPSPAGRLFGWALLLAIASACSQGPDIPRAPSVTALDYETHTPFPIASGAHAYTDCNSCHGDFDTFQQFSCLGCHEHSWELTDPRHASVPDYAWDSTKCYDCHPDGQAEGVDHTAIFPIQAGDSHGGLACGTCHVDPTNRHVVDCLTCHPAATIDPSHGSVGGYARDSALCLRCHGDSQVKPVSTHLPFAILSGYKHYRSSCLTCHPVARTDKPFAQDFNPFDCLSCHSKGAMDDKHKNFSIYRYESTTCVTSGCHANGQKP